MISVENQNSIQVNNPNLFELKYAPDGFSESIAMSENVVFFVKHMHSTTYRPTIS